MDGRVMNQGSRIDWPCLASQLGLQSGVSSHDAAKALALVIGDESLAATVDFYVGVHAGCESCGDPPYIIGAELARLALKSLRPKAAIERCLGIYRDDPDRKRRIAAVELLRTIADASVIPCIDGFLDDADPDVQSLGAAALPELIHAGLIDQADVAGLLPRIERHPDPGVRHVVEQIEEHRQWEAALTDPPTQ